MKSLYILAIIFVILGLIIRLLKENNKKEMIVLTKNNPMTKTELKFIQTIEPIAEKNNLKIIPQIPLQAIIKTNKISDFNKIKSKIIDFAIVDKNYNYKGFIELDDYTHNKQNRIQRDIFINDIFNKINLKLKRIKVSNQYNINEIEQFIKEIANN